MQEPLEVAQLHQQLASEIDLHPDAKESVSREYAKKLAIQHAYAHTLGHYSMQDSSFGNLIIPILRTNEMIRHEFQLL